MHAISQCISSPNSKGKNVAALNRLSAPVFQTRLPGWRGALAAVSAVLWLAACSKPAEKTEDIRPVRVMRLAADKAEMASEVSGEVRPRGESRLGFRVGGKIIARKGDVGATVKRGQALMQLDPQDL